MKMLQHQPGIPNFADEGNPNVPLIGQQEIVLNHVYTRMYPKVPGQYL